MKNILVVVFLLTFTVVANAFELRPEPFSGVVTKVSDGDTVTVKTTSGEAKRIRLAEIDAPELSQRFGHAAGVYLRGIVEGKEVRVIPQSMDRYGRTVAHIKLEGMSVNESIIGAGFAWHYKRYSSSARLAKLESLAKKNELGLWMDANPVPPWDFRRHKKTTEYSTEIKSAVDGLKSKLGW